MNLNTFFGLKNKQWQTFDDKGNRLVVTSLKVPAISVVRLKKQEEDRYQRCVVSVPTLKKEFLKEIQLIGQDSQLKVKDQIKVQEVFKVGDKVNVSGKSIGKGFAGVIKRWGFKGGPSTHGQSDRQRSPGSIGMRTTPGRVWKGKKMAGHMGNVTKTIKNLTVFKFDEEHQEMWVTGLVPGKKGNFIKISRFK